MISNNQTFHDYNGDPNNLCGICLEEVKNSYAVAHTGRGIHHPFHYDCIKECLEYQNFCPSCKDPVDSRKFWSFEKKSIIYVKSFIDNPIGQSQIKKESKRMGVDIISLIGLVIIFASIPFTMHLITNRNVLSTICSEVFGGLAGAHLGDQREKQELTKLLRIGIVIGIFVENIAYFSVTVRSNRMLMEGFCGIVGGITSVVATYAVSKLVRGISHDPNRSFLAYDGIFPFEVGMI